MSIKRLLIGYDGSACSNDALDDLRRAGLPDANIEALIVTIADLLPDLPARNYPTLYAEAATRAREQADHALGEARRLADAGREHLARLFPAWTVHAEAVAGSPYWDLIKKAESFQADLLMVGSEGRSAVGRLTLGSVSHNAILYADCSVRIGRCRVARAQGTSPDAVRLLIGWDGSPDAEAAFRAVGDRHWPAGSECRIVTAIDSNLLTRESAEIDQLQQRARVEMEAMRTAGLNVDEPIVRIGSAKRILLDEAKTWQADCIFVGVKGLSRIKRMLVGSVSSAIAARADCSVEIVRPPREG